MKRIRHVSQLFLWVSVTCLPAGSTAITKVSDPELGLYAVLETDLPGALLLMRLVVLRGREMGGLYIWSKRVLTFPGDAAACLDKSEKYPKAGTHELAVLDPEQAKPVAEISLPGNPTALTLSPDWGIEIVRTELKEISPQFVIEDLPTRLLFDFVAAARTPNDKGLLKFYGGRLLRPERLRHVERVQAQKYLWIDGKIPIWINLPVHAADVEFTFIEVCACDRLTDDDEALYHKREGNPPFRVLGPALPATWVSLQESGKVSLAWRSAE